MKLYDHVEIKTNGIRGIIVDISGDKFTIEADEERKPDDNNGYPGRWPLYTCSLEEIESMEE